MMKPCDDTVRSVSVVMPTYNEAGHIVDLVNAVLDAITLSGVSDVEVVVVDDDSPDGTWRLVEDMSKLDSRIRLLRRMSDHGLTNSIRDGIACARFDVVVWMDCDFSHPPEKIPQLLYMLGEGYDIAVNSRYAVGGGEEREGKGGPLQKFLSWMLNWGTRFLLDAKFSDYTSGFIAVRKSVLADLPLRGDYGEYFIDFIYRALKCGYRVCELPYCAPARRTGESKTGTNLADYSRRGIKYIATIARVRFGSGRALRQ
mgnify:CR=1 FL=1